MFQEAGHSCSHHSDFPAHSDIQCLHLMYAEVTWILVSSGTQVESKMLLDPDYLPDYPSVSYDYVLF